MGTSERFFYENATQIQKTGGPGPGTYNLRSAQGRQVTSDKPSYPIPSFPRADRDRTAMTVYLGPKQQLAFWGRNSPGPAVYTATQSVGQQNSSQRPNVPKFGFGTADRFAYMDVGESCPAFVYMLCLACLAVHIGAMVCRLFRNLSLAFHSEPCDANTGAWELLDLA